MASKNPPGAGPSDPDRAAQGEARGLTLTPGLAERYDAARHCIHCKIAAEDKPGAVCMTSHGPVRCCDSAPHYSKALGRHVREARSSTASTKQVAR